MMNAELSLNLGISGSQVASIPVYASFWPQAFSLRLHRRDACATR